MTVYEAPRIICDNPDSQFSYFAWPSVTRLPDGTLAAVCSGFRLSHVCPFGKAVIFYSRDEGVTWTRPAPVIDTPLDDRDAGLCVTRDGRVILTSFNNTVAFQRNHVRGVVKRHGESPRAELIEAYLNTVPSDAEEKYLGSTYRVSTDGGYTFGSLHRSPVTSPHGPCTMPDGRVLWVGRSYSAASPGGDIICTELDGDDEFRPLSQIRNCTDDCGELFSCEPHSLPLPDGRLLTAIRAQRAGEAREFTVYLCVSEDGGLTHSAPHPVLPHLGGSPPHMLLHSSGDIVMTYGRRETPYGIRARVSRDGGASWGRELILVDGEPSGDLGYPASAELRDGRILTVYYSNHGTARIYQTVWSHME